MSEGDEDRAPPGCGLISEPTRKGLRWLRRILPSEWLSKKAYAHCKIRRWAFVETYVAATTLIVGGFSLGVPSDAHLGWLWLGTIVALVVIAESYLTNTVIVLVDALESGWDARLDLRRNFLLLGLNFLQVVLAFSIAYRLIERVSGGDSFHPAMMSRIDAIAYSASIATTTGFTRFTPMDRAASIAVTIEAVLAILLLVFVLNTFLAARTAGRDRGR